MIEPMFATKKIDEQKGYGQFVLEPLPQSFAHSMGHSLRRTLLSSIKGAALTQIKITGAPHLFSTLKGVRESVLDIALNLKQLRFEVPGDGTYKVNITIKGAQKITGADVEGEATVVNKDLYIGEVTDAKAKIEIEGIVETGYGFVASEDREDKEAGYISIDSSFSPVTKVSFRVEEARVGRKSNHERLILEIWTDESIMPSEVLKTAGEALSKQFAHILTQAETAPGDSAQALPSVMTESTQKLDDIIIDELNLPSRVINALLRENIETVADLLKTGRKRLMVLKGVGRKSIDLIEDELKKMNISFD